MKFIKNTRKNKNYQQYALYECDCGKVFEARVSHIMAGQKSCGCQRKKPPTKTTHGLSKHPAYRIWEGMRARCNNSSHVAYHRYGGRGISICKEWEDCSSFIAWCDANGYEPGLQIDRVDNDKGYDPVNCRFTTPSSNAKNRVDTYWWHTPNGTFPSLKSASQEYGIWLAGRFASKNFPEYYRVKKYADG